MAKNKWHSVTKKDQARIFCSACMMADAVERPAEVCEHSEFTRPGGSKGISFWYYCMEHGKAEGFTEELTK